MHSVAILSTIFAAGVLAGPAHENHARFHRRQDAVEFDTVSEVATTVQVVTFGQSAPTAAANPVVYTTVTAGAAQAAAPTSAAAPVFAASTPASSFVAPLASAASSAVSSASSAASSVAASSGNQWVDLHNMSRAIHGAQPVTWSDDLASKAAQSCPGGDISGAGGSNYAAGTAMDVASAMFAWYSEEADYAAASDNYQSNPGSSGSEILHFSQLVWNESTEIGCYQSTGCSDYGNQFVCLYSPAGNMVSNGEPQYTANVYAPSGQDTSVALQAN